MKALIDGDILLYELGGVTDDEGQPLDWKLVKSRVDAKIRKIVESAGASSYLVFITGEGNFRNHVATIKPYKGHRNQPKPFHYQTIKDYILSGQNHPVKLCEGYEADDGMSVAQMKELKKYEHRVSLGAPPFYEVDFTKWSNCTIICSRDKDLKMVPGWHYQWGAGKQQEVEPHFIGHHEAWRWFFLQLLMGDSTDNILGLYKVGPKNAEKVLEGLTEPLEMYCAVQKEYESRFGSYWQKFMDENAALLWMLREEPDEKPEYQVIEILEEFEYARAQQEAGAFF